MYLLLQAGAGNLQVLLTILFIGLAAMLIIEGIREGKVSRDKTWAMMICRATPAIFERRKPAMTITAAWARRGMRRERSRGRMRGAWEFRNRGRASPPYRKKG